MPRRSVDQGGKPFEFRTGVGGLPQLGGMFRSGDPATIPPHKFHLLVNMRRTPGGTITRPGLGLVFNTGVQECINGLTEDAGEQGGALMLYPGAEAGSNPATFRAIFPDSSPDYSEFAFAIYGPAAAARGTILTVNSPVLAFTEDTAYVGPDWYSRPFIFRGQAVQFALVDRNGTPTIALLGIELAKRSFLQASDCWRNSDGPVGDPLCPGAAGQPTPPTATDPPLWPFQHPVGSVGVLVYFDNPFGSGDWRPDAASNLNIGGGTAISPIDMILTVQERADDVLTGTSGVSETLYFVVRQSAGAWPAEVPPVKRKLIRWDGTIQATEPVAIPDDVRVGLSVQAYGPYLGSAAPTGDPGDWAAYRTESGAWSVIGGAGWTGGVGVDDYSSPTFLPRAMSWGGKGQLLAYGTYFPGTNFIHCWQQVATEFDARRSLRSCTLHDGPEATIVTDCLIVGPFCYALAIVTNLSGGFRLFVGDFRSPLTPVAGSPFNIGLVDSPLNEIWLQSVGGRAYVGGKFLGGPADFSPIASHAVYDVTDPSDIFAVYHVLDSEQTFDNEPQRYSRGALPSVPNDDTGGQGFQAS